MFDNSKMPSFYIDTIRGYEPGVLGQTSRAKYSGFYIQYLLFKKSKKDIPGDSKVKARVWTPIK